MRRTVEADGCSLLVSRPGVRVHCKLRLTYGRGGCMQCSGAGTKVAGGSVYSGSGVLPCWGSFCGRRARPSTLGLILIRLMKTSCGPKIRVLPFFTKGG